MPNHLSLLLGIPAAAALAIAVLGGRRPQLIRAVSIASASLTAILAAALWLAYQPRGAEWQFVEQVNLARIGSGYLVGIDGFSLAMILLTAVAGLAVIVSAIDRDSSWHAAVLATQFASFGMFMSLDLLLWLLFVTAALAVAAVAPRFVGARSPLSKWTRIILILAGAVIAAAVFLVHASGASFDLRALRQETLPAADQAWIFAAFFLGFAIAAGTLFFHRAWAIVPLHAALYALLRVGLPVLPDASRRFASAVMVLAVAGAALAALAALAQATWKRLAGYATVSQLAVAVAGACALTPNGITGGMVLASVPAFGGFIGALPIVGGIWQVNRVAAIVAGASIATVAVAIARTCWFALRRHDRRAEDVALRDWGARELTAVGALLAISLGMGFHPAPLLTRVETSVARVVLRVSPQYAADVADCLSQPLPTPAETGLPPGVVMAAPCAEGTPPHDPHKK